jgi:hypothetical protein
MLLDWSNISERSSAHAGPFGITVRRERKRVKNRVMKPFFKKPSV